MRLAGQCPSSQLRLVGGSPQSSLMLWEGSLPALPSAEGTGIQWLQWKGRVGRAGKSQGVNPQESGQGWEEAGDSRVTSVDWAGSVGV